MRFALAALALAAAAAAPAWAHGEPMSDAELAAARGGFQLPGGLDIRIAVTSDTRIDGASVLRSVYRIDDRAELSVRNAQGAASALDGRDGITLVKQGQNGLIQFSGKDVAVGHLFGGAYGTILANGGNDRAIETATTIDLRIAGATADLIGSAALRAEALALDVTGRLTR